ncbi:MAG: GNAT family N-acetyltransferase [Gemmatimonadota bacterium]
MNQARIRRALVEAALEVERLGLSPGTSGNLSVRVPGGFLVTPSGVPFAAMESADTVFLTDGGEPTGDRLRPSSEWRLHAAIYSDRPDAGAIVHLHSPHATAVACLRTDIPPFHYMVARAGGDSIRCARYETFGTEALAFAALEALEDRKACLLANHGQVALGPTLEDALFLAREVEELAHVWSIALEAGDPEILAPDEIERVREQFRAYGQARADAAREERGGRPSRSVPAQPELRTARLGLRPFGAGDAAAIRELAGAPEIAANTLNVPHPYPEGAAEAWIASHGPAFERGEMAVFAVTEPDGTLVGACGLRIEPEDAIAELGYWIGVPYWNRGYASEAARAVVDFGFESLGLQRIWARVFVRNPASARVVEKAGLRHEGTLRRNLRKGDELLDHHVHGVLREEWLAGRGTREGKETR